MCAFLGRSPCLLPAQALERIKVLNDPNIAAGVRRDLAAAIHAKVSSKQKNGSKKGSWKQYCTSYKDLIHRRLWKVLLDKTSAYWQVVEAVANHMESMGLVYATEPTYVHITSIVCVCKAKQIGDGDTIDVADALNS